MWIYQLHSQEFTWGGANTVGSGGYDPPEVGDPGVLPRTIFVNSSYLKHNFRLLLKV